MFMIIKISCHIFSFILEPNAPTNVRVSDTKDTGLLVNWTAPFPPHGIIKAYQVIYRKELNGQLTQSEFARNETGKWIWGLQPFTTYHIQVGLTEGVHSSLNI